jgi:pilus assembly protein CpaB
MTPLMRRLLALAVAMTLALIGMSAVLDYARRADERAIADQRPVSVLIVSRPIAQGTPSSGIADAVRSAVVPSTAVASGAVNDLDDLAGLVAAVDLIPGEQLLAARFVAPELLEPSDMTPVPAGLQQISFLLPMERIVGGLVAPGDRVAVFVSFDDLVDVADDGDVSTPLTSRTTTSLLVDELLITRVQFTAPPATTSGADILIVPAGDLLVTFAVDTITAERLTYAFDQGRVRISLLDPRTSQSEGTRITRENILG